MDYVDKTIHAYDSAPDKFVSATDAMVSEPEMRTLFQSMPAGNKSILDVGCGPGRDAHFFSQQGYSVTGIDMSNEFIKRAKHSYPSIKFELMDVRHLDFADNTFGAVWCSAVLLHLKDPDIEKALKEIYRVLQQHGVLAVSFKEGEGEKEVLETFTTNLSRFYNFKTQDTLGRLVENTGFQIIDSHKYNERERFGSDKRDLNWVWVIAQKIKK